MTRFGWASREFTPDRPALVQGQMYVRIARDAKDPLTLTALAVEADDAGRKRRGRLSGGFQFSLPFRFPGGVGHSGAPLWA